MRDLTEEEYGIVAGGLSVVPADDSDRRKEEVRKLGEYWSVQAELAAYQQRTGQTVK